MWVFIMADHGSWTMRLVLSEISISPINRQDSTCDSMLLLLLQQDCTP
jgi:hypothetical protein